MTLSWENEYDFQLGIEFLTKMGAACGAADGKRSNKPPFFYLKNEQQLDALYEFRRKLRER